MRRTLTKRRTASSRIDVLNDGRLVSLVYFFGNAKTPANRFSLGVESISLEKENRIITLTMKIELSVNEEAV